MGSAPIADYFTDSGVSGQAWALGRDDTLDFVLLEVIDPPGTFDFLEVGAQIPPVVNAELALLQFPGTGSVIDKKTALVAGSRQDFNTGLNYIQLQAVPAAGAEGGALVDRNGTLHGIRMDGAHTVELGFARPGEVYAITSESLRGVVLPRLETGLTIINKPDSGEGDSLTARPGFPAVFKGDITFRGEPAQIGGILYARVTKAGRSDVWVARELVVEGRYLIPVSVPATGYASADVAFFFMAKKADQGARFDSEESTTLNLTFQ